MKRFGNGRDGGRERIGREKIGYRSPGFFFYIVDTLGSLTPFTPASFPIPDPTPLPPPPSPPSALAPASALGKSSCSTIGLVLNFKPVRCG